MIGRRISHYRLEERLGAGGMGEVYRASDLALGREVAIKLLPQRFDPGLRDRLLREAEAGGRLQHPGIASLIESGEDDGASWIAMEFVPGGSLRARLARGAVPLADALGIGASVLEALAHAHRGGGRSPRHQAREHRPARAAPREGPGLRPRAPGVRAGGRRRRPARS
jgi:serine/threonine-protein kinase